MQTTIKYIALTSYIYIYIYIYIGIYLCISTNLTCGNPTKNEENDCKIKRTNQSTWDLYNLIKQKFRRKII